MNADVRDGLLKRPQSFPSDSPLSIFVTVLPPVLVPRYSEFPANQSHQLLPYQQVQEPSMPHNVSYPHGFPQSPGAASSNGGGGPASPNSQYSLPADSPPPGYQVLDDHRAMSAPPPQQNVPSPAGTVASGDENMDHTGAPQGGMPVPTGLPRHITPNGSTVSNPFNL